MSPQVCVSGSCVNLTNYQTNSSNCGASQTICGVNQACLSGSCVSTTDVTSCFNGTSYTSCASGGTCGANGMTGLCACSSGILNDNNNCGSCGNACTGATAYCSYGTCIDLNLCTHGGCTGTPCDGVSLGGTCSDGNKYAGGNMEMSAVDVGPNFYSVVNQDCQNLGSGWSLPSEEQLIQMYNNNSSLNVGTLYHWSSSQGDSSDYWAHYFSGDYQYNLTTDDWFAGRCVKSL